MAFIQHENSLLSASTQIALRGARYLPHLFFSRFTFI